MQCASLNYSVASVRLELLMGLKWHYDEKSSNVFFESVAPNKHRHQVSKSNEKIKLTYFVFVLLYSAAAINLNERPVGRLGRVS